MTGGNLTLYYEALMDASVDADDIENNRCGAYGHDDRGYGNECCRDRGHTDNAYAQGLHVSFDSDHYQAWPVGWRTSGDRIARVIDPTFAQQVTGTPDYVKGFSDCLSLVQGILRGQKSRKI